MKRTTLGMIGFRRSHSSVPQHWRVLIQRELKEPITRVCMRWATGNLPMLRDRNREWMRRASNAFRASTSHAHSLHVTATTSCGSLPYSTPFQALQTTRHASDVGKQGGTQTALARG